ncbi:MAG TPA: hypothetical protein VIZ90_08555 [Rhizobiaceae bacterium]
MPLPLTMAAMSNLPGNTQGFAQYGGFNNPTWDCRGAAVPSRACAGGRLPVGHGCDLGDAVAPGFVRLSIGCEPAEELW